MVLLTPGAAALLPKSREAKNSFNNYPEVSEDLLTALNWCSGWLCAPNLDTLMAPALSSPGPALLLPQNLHWDRGQEEEVVGDKEDIQQPAIRNTQDLSPLPTARLSLPQNHEPVETQPSAWPQATLSHTLAQENRSCGQMCQRVSLSHWHHHCSNH